MRVRTNVNQLPFRGYKVQPKHVGLSSVRYIKFLHTFKHSCNKRL